jgi:SagB-type dehydrogenase family enzyme
MHARTLGTGLGCLLALSLAVAPGRADAKPPAKDPPVALPAPDRAGTVPLEQAMATRRSIRTLSGDPIPVAALSQLLWAAQGVTDDQGHRTTPSARATYPLDVLAVVGKVEGMAPGLYRYDPAGHALLPIRKGDHLDAFVDAAFGQDWARKAAVILAVVATPERARAKMGDRAGRFAGLESGLAAQNVLLQVTTLGLGATFVGGFDPAKAASFLGLLPGQTVHAILPIGVRK